VSWRLQRGRGRGRGRRPRLPPPLVVVESASARSVTLRRRNDRAWQAPCPAPTSLSSTAVSSFLTATGETSPSSAGDAKLEDGGGGGQHGVVVGWRRKERGTLTRRNEGGRVQRARTHAGCRPRRRRRRRVHVAACAWRCAGYSSTSRSMGLRWRLRARQLPARHTPPALAAT